MATHLGTLIHTLLLIPILCSICRAVLVNTTDPLVWNINPATLNEIQVMGLPEFSNSNFTLGFWSSPASGLFTLGIIMQNFSSMVIWEAKREHPVGVNASLRLTIHGNLELWDSNGRFPVWSTETAGKNATTVEVQETGNLVVMSGDSPLWQSFDYPTDTLVVNQKFKVGMKLQSRKSDNDSSSGFYSLVMKPGGLVLYSSFSGREEEPYWIREYKSTVQDSLASVNTRVCGSSVSAALDDSENTLKMNMTLDSAAASCGFSRTQSWPLKENITVQNRSFIRLESDGNLRVHSLNQTGQEEISFELFNRSSTCMLPQKCQTFGLCSNGECDSCLNSDGARSPWSSSCKLPAVESCTNVETLDFLPVPGAEYFSSKYLNTSGGQSFQDCRRKCLNNCSCVAFFFWEDSSSCFTTDNINTLQKVADQRHVAYVKTSDGPGSGLASGATAGIVVGCLAFGFLVVLVPLLLCMRRRRQKSAVDYDSDTSRSAENPGPVRYSYTELEQFTENFSKDLGNGGVYQGVLPDGKKIVVKNVERGNINKRKFQAQVSVLGRIHHWNLIKLIGFCSEGYNRLVVYEYMENGSLDKWIYRGSQESLEWELRMGILLGVARGLAYLHDECMERIVHLDVKPENILLDPSFVAKVAELGQFSKTGEVDIGHAAPEVVLSGGLVTDKSDVYSFGVMVLEVISGLRCLSEKERFYLPELAVEMVGRGRTRELVDPRVTDADEGKVGSALSIAFQCVQEDPSSRPSMRRVVQMLEGSSEISETPRNLLWKRQWT